jgi:hypothetical protein
LNGVDFSNGLDKFSFIMEALRCFKSLNEDSFQIRAVMGLTSPSYLHPLLKLNLSIVVVAVYSIVFYVYCFFYPQLGHQNLAIPH